VKRKIREVIKEDKGEKDSLLNDFKIKSQAAMEYLMTYGWAILIIALTLAVLYSLGIMNPKNFIPRAPPGSCFVFRPNGPGTTDFISLQGTCGYLPMYVASFNGINAYVRVNNVLNGLSVTVLAWARSATVNWNTYGWIASSRVANGFIIHPEAGSKRWAGYILNSSGAYFRIGSYTPADITVWHQYGVAYDYDNKRAYMYFDGQKVVDTGLSITRTVGTINVEFGHDYGFADRYGNGSIANVQIYNTALSQQEIQYLYQQGLGGGPVRLQNLVLWLPLNGDAKDYSGNNNHGTINGGVTFVQNYNPP
jgi:hypothetical protein